MSAEAKNRIAKVLFHKRFKDLSLAEKNAVLRVLREEERNANKSKNRP